MTSEEQSSSSPPQQAPHIYRPIPRRNFSRHSTNADSPDPFSDSTLPSQSQPSDGNDWMPRNTGSSDFLAQLNARLLRSSNTDVDGSCDGANDTELRNNKSFLDMTSSTLYGIYDGITTGAATAGASEIPTPWGTGAETPLRGTTDSGLGINAWENGGSLGSPDGGMKMKQFSRRGTMDIGERNNPSRSKSNAQRQRQRHGLPHAAILLSKILALFSFGVVYGVIVSLLHGTRELAPVSSRVGLERLGWLYFACWGVAGVVLGSLLPWVDGRWENQTSRPLSPLKVETDERQESLSEQWNDIVRSVGAFVGIAFAIRKLPWQSTLQLTLTLALVNPVLWYIIDRSRTGLTVSTVVTSILTSFIILSNPDVLPAPGLPATVNSTHPLPPSKLKSQARENLPLAGGGGDDLFAGLVTYDSLAVATWVGSVLFCSCVCFGSIGRRLAILDEWSLRR